MERRKSRLPEPDADTKRLEKYAYNYRYVDIARDISPGNYAFTTPRRKYVNKMGTKKKREVFVFNGDEMMALKLVAHLLYGYDRLFSPNLYSFRRDIGVKDAIRDLLRTLGLGSMHGYKVD